MREVNVRQRGKYASTATNQTILRVAKYVRIRNLRGQEEYTMTKRNMTPTSARKNRWTDRSAEFRAGQEYQKKRGTAGESNTSQKSNLAPTKKKMIDGSNSR